MNIRDAYNEWAETYDSNTNATRDLNLDIVRSAPLALSEARVLELGCGTGLNTAYFATPAASVLALDFSPEMLARARKRVDAARVEFRLADILKPLAVEKESVDVVSVNLVLEHVRALSPLFEEIHRVLRPGGQCFFSEIHPHRQLAGSGARFQRSGTDGEVRVEAHLHSVSEYLNAAIAAGFTLDRIEESWGASDTIPRLLSVLLRKPLETGRLPG